MLLKGAIKMKRILAIIISVAMIATMLAVSVSAASVFDATQGGVPADEFTSETLTQGENLNVKVTNVIHKYAVDVVFSLDVLDLGGNITWNVETMKYDVSGANSENATREVKVYNRSDLPVYVYAGITDTDLQDGITISTNNGDQEHKLMIDKATAGAGTTNGERKLGKIGIDIKSTNWNAVAEYYAAKRLASANQATDTFRIATVTVTITK